MEKKVEDAKISYIRVCAVMRESKKNPGTKFPDYFVIFLEEDSNGELKPIKTNFNGKTVNLTMKCHIKEEPMKKLNALGKFPFDIAVDSNRRAREGVSDYIITDDRVAATKELRIDKNGNSHKIMILEDFVSATPSKSYSIDDFLKEQVK